MSEGPPYLYKLFLGGERVTSSNINAYKAIVKTAALHNMRILSHTNSVTLSNVVTEGGVGQAANVVRERMDNSDCYIGMITKPNLDSIFNIGQEIGMYKLQKKPMLVVFVGNNRPQDLFPIKKQTIDGSVQTTLELKDLLNTFLQNVKAKIIARNEQYFRVGSLEFDLDQSIVNGENNFTKKFTSSETTLLAGLLLEQGSPIATNTLIDTIYGTQNITSKLSGLRHFVHTINGKLGEEYIEAVRFKGYQIMPRGHIKPYDPDRFKKVSIFNIDQLDHRVFSNGTELTKWPNERRALYYLIQNCGTKVPKDELERFIFGEKAELVLGALPSVIYRARKLLSEIDETKKFICSERGYYQFNP